MSEYEDLKIPVDTGGPNWDPPTKQHRNVRLPLIVGGYIIASCTTWAILWQAVTLVAQRGTSCDYRPPPGPVPLGEAAVPRWACGPQPPDLILAAGLIITVAWILWVSFLWMRYGPSGGTWFALRALIERAEILSDTLLSGALFVALTVTGAALCVGNGGILGQLIAVPQWLFAGGPRQPVMFLAGKLVATFFVMVAIAGRLSISAQKTN